MTFVSFFLGIFCNVTWELKNMKPIFRYDFSTLDLDL